MSVSEQTSRAKCRWCRKTTLRLYTNDVIDDVCQDCGFLLDVLKDWYDSDVKYLRALGVCARGGLNKQLLAHVESPATAAFKKRLLKMAVLVSAALFMVSVGLKVLLF